MGTSRRYADDVDRRSDEKYIARLAKQAPLQTLSPQELELSIQPVTKTPKPEIVRAWVRFGAEPFRVKHAEAVMWTSSAIAIRFTACGTEYRCWVWANAVEIPRREVT